MPVTVGLAVLESFLAGMLTPLTAACVIPLYPGYLSYLAGKEEQTSAIHLGLAVTAGVLVFMLCIGIVFSAVLQRSLTGFIGNIGPVAFTGLLVAGVLLLLDIDLNSVLPEIQSPDLGGPLRNAFGFGFFFGVIVIPCNPGFIAFFLSRSLLLGSPLTALGNFLAFGTGIAAPLLLFSIVSEQWSQQVIAWMTAHRTLINRATGTILIVVALYYLVFVFRLLPLP
ncbi:MAG: cytochrome c biogenesis protein CcdA [Candidatus Nanohaloarchaea archaeon]|nr:cytochrome c biogenesis protein CcdA [Candidatus Nanohaloarchaea archaeon]